MGTSTAKKARNAAAWADRGPAIERITAAGFSPKLLGGEQGRQYRIDLSNGGWIDFAPVSGRWRQHGGRKPGERRAKGCGVDSLVVWLTEGVIAALRPPATAKAKAKSKPRKKARPSTVNAPMAKGVRPPRPHVTIFADASFDPKTSTGGWGAWIKANGRASIAGGAAMGYWRAGFDVVGVDKDPQPRYPFAFIQADVLSLDPRLVRWFAAIHASPPCQRFSDLAKRNGNAGDHADLIEPTRRMLTASGLPYVMENVPEAPLSNPVILCGTMFPGLRVLRHRAFESNVRMVTPAHLSHPLVYTLDKRKAHYGRLNQMEAFVQVTGGGNSTKAAAADAMGIDWMTKSEMNEAIPPAYTEFLGRQLMAHLQLAEAA